MTYANLRRSLAAGLCALTLLCAAPKAAPAEAAPADALCAQLDQLSAEELTQLRDRIDARLRALGAYPFVKLSEGSKGDEVTALQQRLKELGYFHEEPDGRYRTSTVNAMKAFEKIAGLKRNGIATEEDQHLLFADEAPRPTASPTPRPTPTPNKSKDYDVFDYRLAGLMHERYTGNRYRMTGTILALLDDGARWLVELDRDKGLVAVERFPEERAAGKAVRVWGELIGLTAYESESGTVTVPLIKCEYLE